MKCVDFLTWRQEEKWEKAKGKKNEKRELVQRSSSKKRNRVRVVKDTRVKKENARKGRS